MMTRTVWSIAAACLGLAVIWITRPQPESPSAAPPRAPARYTFASAPDAVPYRGVAIQLASGFQPVETYGPLIDEIADLGANTVLFSVAGHMEHARAQAIFIDVRRTPGPADLRSLIARARARDLKVFLMPIVLLKNPRGSEWRGVIDPPDWDTWWEEYTAFLLHFTDVAREAGADGLLVGSELISTEKYTSRWVRVIEAVRPRFHGGLLGYSANWDHYRPVQFWDKLDFIGMTSYYTLADRSGASVEEIVQRWQPIRGQILDWQRQIGKPILMTEVGWCSQEGAATAPWNYYKEQRATPAGLEEQRRLYEAFIRVWGACPQLLGAIWWEWKHDAAGPTDYGYTPKGKPAEQVLRAWFEAGQAASAGSAAAE